MDSERAEGRDGRQDLGNVALVMEDSRATWGWTRVEPVLMDCRYAAQTLRKSPEFAAAAVLTLGLGIGANTALFSLLQALVFRPIPVAEPERLVQLTYTLPFFETNPNNWNSFFGHPHLEMFRTQSKSLTGVLGNTRLGRANLAHDGSPGLAQGDAVSPSFFAVLGVTL